jgi:hypothetical protein
MGYLARMLTRDLPLTDVSALTLALAHFNPELGDPLFGREDWGEPCMVPGHIFGDLELTKATFQLHYPFHIHEQIILSYPILPFPVGGCS